MGLLSKIIGGSVAEPIEAVGNVLTAIMGDKGEKMTHEAIMAKLAMQPAMLQVELNKVEASHRSVWVAGWRPGIGWVCAVSLALFFIPQYTMAAILWVKLSWVATEVVPYPATVDGLMELVVGMLGFGVLRTAEKLSGKTK
jgi:hypothetical protein